MLRDDGDPLAIEEIIVLLKPVTHLDQRLILPTRTVEEGNKEKVGPVVKE